MSANSPTLRSERMDNDISRWLLEFLLRSSVPDSLIALPLPAADSRLKKTLLLRTLQTLLRTATLSETALNILENLEPSILVSDALRRAYCAVAVECTVKYLTAYPDDIEGEYAGAVARIWRGRVMELVARRSGLVSGELVRWRVDFEAALDDSRIRERLAGLNSRRDAMNEVRAYLKEAWETIEPSILETETVEAMEMKKGVDSRDSDNTDTNNDNDNGNGFGNDNDNAGEDDHDDGACMEDVATQHDENQGKEPLEERVDANQEVGGSDSTPRTRRVKVSIQKRNPQLKQRHSALRACQRGVKISDLEEVESAKSWSKPDPVPSPEVRKVRESLKSSSMELRALVNDPLPEALHISEVVKSKLVTSDTKIEPPTENQSEDVDVPDPNVCQTMVLFQPNDANLGKKSSVHCSNIHQTNFIERNRSARSSEWDDSMDCSPQAKQPRRKKRKWSSLEEETLRAGVKMFGEGNWATIRSFYSNIFDHRSGVDLKDKWRNMIR